MVSIGWDLGAISIRRLDYSMRVAAFFAFLLIVAAAIAGADSEEHGESRTGTYGLSSFHLFFPPLIFSLIALVAIYEPWQYTDTFGQRIPYNLTAMLLSLGGA